MTDSWQSSEKQVRDLLKFHKLNIMGGFEEGLEDTTSDRNEKIKGHKDEFFW